MHACMHAACKTASCRFHELHGPHASLGSTYVLLHVPVQYIREFVAQQPVSFIDRGRGSYWPRGRLYRVRVRARVRARARA